MSRFDGQRHPATGGMKLAMASGEHSFLTGGPFAAAVTTYNPGTSGTANVG
jgi:hypothetical protein